MSQDVLNNRLVTSGRSNLLGVRNLLATSLLGKRQFQEPKGYTAYTKGSRVSEDSYLTFGKALAVDNYAILTGFGIDDGFQSDDLTGDDFGGHLDDARGDFVDHTLDARGDFVDHTLDVGGDVSNVNRVMDACASLQLPSSESALYKAASPHCIYADDPDFDAKLRRHLEISVARTKHLEKPVTGDSIDLAEDIDLDVDTYNSDMFETDVSSEEETAAAQLPLGCVRTLNTDSDDFLDDDALDGALDVDSDDFLDAVNIEDFDSDELNFDMNIASDVRILQSLSCPGFVKEKLVKDCIDVGIELFVFAAGKSDSSLLPFVKAAPGVDVTENRYEFLNWFARVVKSMDLTPSFYDYLLPPHPTDYDYLLQLLDRSVYSVCERRYNTWWRQHRRTLVAFWAPTYTIYSCLMHVPAPYGLMGEKTMELFEAMY